MDNRNENQNLQNYNQNTRKSPLKSNNEFDKNEDYKAYQQKKNQDMHKYKYNAE